MALPLQIVERSVILSDYLSTARKSWYVMPISMMISEARPIWFHPGARQCLGCSVSLSSFKMVGLSPSKPLARRPCRLWLLAS